MPGFETQTSKPVANDFEAKIAKPPTAVK